MGMSKVEKLLKTLHADTSRFKYAGSESSVITKGPDKGEFRHDVRKFESDSLKVYVDKKNLMVSVSMMDGSSVIHPSQTLVEHQLYFFKLLQEYQERFDKQAASRFNNPNRVIN